MDDDPGRIVERVEEVGAELVPEQLDAGGPIPDEAAGRPLKKQRNGMSRLTDKAWKDACLHLGQQLAEMVDKLEQRAPEGRECSISYALTLTFDHTDHTQKGAVLRRGTTAHYAAKHILSRQQNDEGRDGLLLPRYKNKMQQYHLERHLYESEQEEQQAVVKVVGRDLSTVRQLLNQHCNDLWCFDPTRRWLEPA